jgi:uncharacterized RDD family membrane protein YckC
MIPCRRLVVKKKQGTVTIETPEHFELQFELAGIGTRFLAFLIDRTIQLGLIVALVVIVALLVSLLWKGRPSTDLFSHLELYLRQWIIGAVILVYGIVLIGYFILFEYFWSGSTPGKRSLEIRVIRKDGRPISFLDSAVRNILRMFDVLFEVYPLGLGVMFLDPRNRRLGDLAAGTLVIVDQAVRRPAGQQSVIRSPDEDPVIRQVVTDMTPEDYSLLSKFLSRRSGLEPEHRKQLAREIYDRLCNDATPRSVNTETLETTLQRIEYLYRQRTRIL